jgi:hypothetical protein
MNTLIVYLHVIAACVAVGVLLRQDLMLAKTAGRRLSIGAVKELKQAAQTIGIALILLWVSGLTLVIIGRIGDPNYLMNQKLWAKIAVVAVLTLNGLALHHFSFPRVVSGGGVIGLSVLEQIAVVSTGATSTVSWLFACYLGVARPWNHSIPFDSVLFIYLSLILPACVIGCAYVLGLSTSAAVRTYPTATSDTRAEPSNQGAVDPETGGKLNWAQNLRQITETRETSPPHRRSASSIRVRPA